MIDPFTIKPLDAATIVASAKATGGQIITVEDHYKEGGFIFLFFNRHALKLAELTHSNTPLFCVKGQGGQFSPFPPLQYNQRSNNPKLTICARIRFHGMTEWLIFITLCSGVMMLLCEQRVCLPMAMLSKV